MKVVFDVYDNTGTFTNKEWDRVVGTFVSGSAY